jgi:hypothetical protein
MGTIHRVAFKGFSDASLSSYDIARLYFTSLEFAVVYLRGNSSHRA